MRHIIKTISLVAVIALNFSCKKQENTVTPTPEVPVKPEVPVVTTPKLASGVYAVGAVTSNTTPLFYTKAVVWKNGVMSSLSSNISNAFRMAIQGDDIYVCGFDNQAGTNIACYWKNGELKKLTDEKGPYCEAVNIAVKGSDVYVIGSINSNTRSEAAYWKNGTLVKLSADNAREARAEGVAILGNDIYISGSATITPGKNVACYWKNGVYNILSPETYTSGAYKVATNGKDVYIIGHVSGSASDVSPVYSPVPVVWKNGVLSKLNTSLSYASASDIKIAGDDVYISGYGTAFGKNVGMYWKNGVALSVPNCLSATNIAIQGNDVYVCGYYKKAEDPANSYGSYWKNGVQVLIPDVTNQVLDIAIVP